MTPPENAPVHKIAAYIPISRELREEVDRRRNPWRYPDPPIDTQVDPFPTITKLARFMRGRLSDIAYVIRHGIPQEDS